ncbi:hypothetical protein C8R43DRAFT_917465 [Mycena crocata]|nr:hypothetical protein C8R43DRAFT_917465 [Mycena crocata]
MDPFPSVHFTSAIGLQCYNCLKFGGGQPNLDGKESPTLLRCGGCHKVWYCSAACQQAHWREHKDLCKAVKRMRNDENTVAYLREAFPKSAENSVANLTRVSLAHKNQMVELCEKTLGRSLNNREFDILAYEPRCLACARTDIVLHAGPPKGSASGTTLTPCPRCKMVFYCSDEHAAVARPLHTSPSADVPHGVSQCETNHRICGDLAFGGLMTPAYLQALMWRFLPRQQAWTSLKGLKWTTFLHDRVKKVLSDVSPALTTLSAECLRLVGSHASPALTILHALEQLNTTTEWTSLPILTIHVLAGPPDLEPSRTWMYEALLHRLPEVKILNIFFCGPIVAEFVPPVSGPFGVIKELDTCDDCYDKGGTIFLHYVGEDYGDYVQGQGAAFKSPDLVIGQNSFLTTNDPAGWRETLKTLVNHRLPSVFTAYDQRIAERDLALLTQSGAGLLPRMTVAANPWADPLVNPNFDRLHGFHAPNGWFTGRFADRILL